MRFLWFLLPLVSFAQESFISDYEYGDMLYNNPRGISCTQCHGEDGSGKKIADYYVYVGTKEEKKKKINRVKKTLAGSDIRQKSLQEMIKSLSSSHTVMPRYYLTDKEVEAIYNYLKEKNES